jgi:hypothetical protein
MTTMKIFLATASCGMVLLGAVAAQAMGLRYFRGPNGPNCFESPEVRVINGQRDIPFTGALTAVLAPTYDEFACPVVGIIFDDQTTLIVDCLHSDDEIEAFLGTVRDNDIATVRELDHPDPPPVSAADEPSNTRRLARDVVLRVSAALSVVRGRTGRRRRNGIAHQVAVSEPIADFSGYASIWSLHNCLFLAASRARSSSNRAGAA